MRRFVLLALPAGRLGRSARYGRLAAGDSRLSLEQRYGTQPGYVEAVKRAAERLVKQRFLLQEVADRLVERAERTPVLP